MDLFELNENDFTVKLNRKWIWMIPEFADIMKRDKGSSGDKGGHRKLWARRRFAYIYFMIDFKSPLYTWDVDEKMAEALRYSDMTKKDAEADYMVLAMQTYRNLQNKSARSLRTLESVKKGMDELDDYFENIDFKAVDKMGRVKYTAQDFVKNISMLNKAYDGIKDFENRVMAELTKSGGIRGTATKGDREMEVTAIGGKDQLWDEAGPPVETDGPDWLNMVTGTDFKDELEETY